MRRVKSAHPFICVTCEFAIAGNPVFHVGLPFCCAGCVAGGPCTCSYDADDHARSARTSDAALVTVMSVE